MPARKCNHRAPHVFAGRMKVLIDDARWDTIRASHGIRSLLTMVPPRMWRRARSPDAMYAS